MVSDVQRRPLDAVLKKYTTQFCHCIKKRRDMPIRTWMEAIRKDTRNLELSIDFVYDTMKWKERILNPNLNSLGAGG